MAYIPIHFVVGLPPTDVAPDARETLATLHLDPAYVPRVGDHVVLGDEPPAYRVVQVVWGLLPPAPGPAGPWVEVRVEPA